MVIMYILSIILRRCFGYAAIWDADLLSMDS